jgi:hypothetical protein
MILNIIHLPSNFFQRNSAEWYEAKKRKENLKKEMKTQTVMYFVWDGVLDITSPCTGISQAHKQIVREAKELNLDMIAIAEDDIVFNGAGAWDYFVKNIPESFDLYMGVSYYTQGYENGIVNKPFDSMTLYVVHKRFYDDFLALPEDNHIDRELSKLVDTKEIRISPLYVCHQLNGYSFNAKRNRDYHERIDGRPKYQAKS